MHTLLICRWQINVVADQAKYFDEDNGKIRVQHNEVITRHQKKIFANKQTNY